MSIGHRLEEDELVESSPESLFRIIGESDTPLILARGFSIDTDHDIPAGGGSSLDRKTHYIDRVLYQQVMDDEFKVANMRPVDIINAWLQHEHSEICINAGDNPADTYIACHHFALRWEHTFVKFLGANVTHYEEKIWPGLEQCYAREPKKPPKDLWCSPHLNLETARDAEILKALIKLGVYDAGKRSKYQAHYGLSEHDCKRCRNFHLDKLNQYGGTLALCKVVSGVVRYDRGCDYWIQQRKPA